ncbi:2OG-Fe dioxygenase family protein [Streptomyces sp. LARHCF249]
MPSAVLPGPLTRTDIGEGIRKQGWVFAPGTGFDTGPGAQEFRQLSRAYEDLRPDEYLADGGAYRFRRHVRYTHRAASQGVLRAHPPGPYHQSAEVNPFAGGSPRLFAPVTGAVRVNPFLHRLLLHGVGVFSELDGAEPGRTLDWEVDVHLVRIRASAREQGLPSPEGVHRDGFDYISLHLIGRAGVTGGRSIICDPSQRPLARPLLAAPLDSLYADDRRILHGTEPVRLDPASGRPYGYRDMLLTSYRRIG